MSVEKMKAASVVGRMSKLDETIELCLSSGYFHAESAMDMLGSAEGFKAVATENTFSAQLDRLTNLFKQFGVTPPETVDEKSQHYTDSFIDETLDSINTQLSEVQAERTRLQTEIDELEHKISHLKHFESLHLDLNDVFDCEFIKVRFGRLPVDSYKKIRHHSSNEILFYPTSSNEDYYWGMYVAPVRRAKEIDRIFASLFFEKLILPDNVGTPQEIMKQYKDEVIKKHLQIEKLNKTINECFVQHEKECFALYAQLKKESDIAAVKQYVCEYNNTFMLIGWVPESKVTDFKALLQSVGKIDVDFSEPDEVSRLKPPTKLKNGFLFRPFQFFVEIYGVPDYNELDPTAFVAITYTILYGIMFADLGQGIILALAGFLMWKIKKMALGKILIPCGIFGALFGLVFGSVFGDEEMLNPMYRALGFSEKPIDVMSSATTLLAFSVGIGIFLLLIAMLFGVVANFKRKDTGAAIFSSGGIAGFLLYSGILVLAASILLKLNIPTAAIIIPLIVLPIISMLLSQPLSSLVASRGFRVDSVGDYILETVFELIEVLLSMFSNTVSFLRVGAFVLIHAGMMLAFTSLSAIVGGGVGGTILMIFGNAFVIVLEGLLVGIQVLRLEFYEMFSHFYEGNGQKFTPLSSLIKGTN